MVSEIHNWFKVGVVAGVVILAFVISGQTSNLNYPPAVIVHYSCDNRSNDFSLAGNTLFDQTGNSCVVTLNLLDSQSPPFSKVLRGEEAEAAQTDQLPLEMEYRLTQGSPCDVSFSELFVDRNNELYSCYGLVGT